MRGYLLDTNQLGKAVRPGSLVRQRITAARKIGEKFGTCIPVLCELEVGILQVNNPAAYRTALARLLREVRIWPIDVVTVTHYGEIRQELRQKGSAMSQVDMMLGALARQMKVTLLSADKDFQALSKISVEDWSI